MTPLFRKVILYRAKEPDPGGDKSWQRLRKGVVDLPRRAEISQAANARYLTALAAAETATPLGKLADAVGAPVLKADRRFRGLNPLSGPDAELAQILLRGKFTLKGFRNRDVRERLHPHTTCPTERRRQSGQVSRLLRLFRVQRNSPRIFSVASVPFVFPILQTIRSCMLGNPISDGLETRKRIHHDAEMKFLTRKSRLCGDVTIPGSKSHTIRAVAIASLAPGPSRILAPLESADTVAAVEAYQHLGAQIDREPDVWHVRGTGGSLQAPKNVIDVKNSGTTLRTVLGSCALLTDGMAVVTGDAQVCNRPAGPLADSLNDLGASVCSTRNTGCAPFVIRGRLRGGETTIEALTSQYVTSLLLNTPLSDGETTIHVPVLNEQPYVQMTLDWLERQGVEFTQEGLREFRVPGGQEYQPVDCKIPADFSSATFFLAAGALGDNDVVLHGLDLNDSQGDKAVVDYLKQLGANVEIDSESIRVHGGSLQGTELDLNATPDALPMMAVVGCFARGRTTLANVPQARIKETDRISVMCAELSRMGAQIHELADGLIIEESELVGAEVDGHADHRVVMALAVAGLASEGETVIRSAEAVEVTFPTFLDCMTGLGADLTPYSENDKC